MLGSWSEFTLKKKTKKKPVETKDGKFFGKIETQNNLQGTIGKMMFDSCWKSLLGKLYAGPTTQEKKIKTSTSKTL
jgi:hypothetical protein